MALPTTRADARSDDTKPFRQEPITMPAKPSPAFSLWQLVAIDAIAVGGIIALHLMLPETVPTSVHIAEAVAIGGAGATCAWFWWKYAQKEIGGGDTAAAPASTDLDALRKENAENLRVLQEDIRSLGTALLKKLSASAKPETEHFEAIAGTVTDLAVSLAEARETIAAIATDAAEAKSAVFEVQAQVDWLSDALHNQEGAPERIRPGTTDDAGEGAAPGSIGKALAAGAAGAAVARLIGNGAAKTTFETVAPLASTDIEGAYESGDEIIPSQDFAADNDTMEPEWEAPGEEYPELSEPLPDTFARTVAPESRDEAAPALNTAHFETDGVNEDDYADSAATAVADQPDLLALAEESETRRKPRRPGKNDTALVAHVMIGIGNKPYLRGIGPGLSPEKGVPMEYVDVGRWQWICAEAGAPVTISLWKNDEEPAEGDLISIPAGMTLEIHPHFSH